METGMKNGISPVGKGVDSFDASEKRTYDDASLSEKRGQIQAVCKNGDTETIRALAISEHGLVDDEMRRLAWPILLGYSDPAPRNSSWRGLPAHRDEGQVKLDVDRSFVYYPKGESDRQLDRRKGQLSDLITEVLRLHPRLCYFQGYHDIMQVLLLVLDQEKAVPAAERVSLLRIRDYMLPNISASTSHLQLLPSILYAVDAPLQRHLSRVQPFFALPAMLTLYSHDIQEYGDIARLFDFFLACEAAMPLYFFAVIILARRTQLLDIDPQDSDMLHFVLSKLPKPLDIEGLISDSMALFRKAPPERLPGSAWRHISSCSVLRTTHDMEGLRKQSLQDGEVLFERQARQLQFQQRLLAARKAVWRARRPAGAISAAVLIAAFAWWAQRERSLGVVVHLWQRLRALLL